LQLSQRISALAERTPGFDQYAIQKYAEAFEVIPRTLAESAGLDATETLAKLYTAHHNASRPKASKPADKAENAEDDEEDEVPCFGVDLDNSAGNGVIDAEEEGILDLMVTKSWAIKLATEAARTVLSVDQIIVARQAGGPKPPGPNPNWDEDD
jgi:T-complex protein 1 subunit theta